MDKTVLFMLFAAAALVTLSTARLPCTHPLRISRPHLFTHCPPPTSSPTPRPRLCRYTEWSDWEVVQGSTKSVPKTQCKSGEAYTEKRTRDARRRPRRCKDVEETREICLPDAVDRLILALGLGSSGHNIKPTLKVGLRPSPGLAPAPNLRCQDCESGYYYGSRCPQNGRNGYVCNHLAGRGKRSAMLREFSNLETAKVKKREAPTPSNKNPAQFNWREHAHRFRRSTQQECDPYEPQHVLFVLDSSGSIGDSSYTKMKNAIATLTPLFCKEVHFALLTFSTKFNLEFCFDCFDSTFLGRQEAADAIRAAKYQAGVTYTARATKCICDDILAGDCGFTAGDCLDVVYITDGQSNDPRRDVCDEIKCLHKRAKVNTYAIGINGFDEDEINCIADGSDRMSTFEFDSFNAFELAINNTIDRLIEILPSKPYACAALDGEIDPTGFPNDYDDYY